MTGYPVEKGDLRLSFFAFRRLDMETARTGQCRIESSRLVEV